MINAKDIEHHVEVLKSIDQPVDLLGQNPIHPGFDLQNSGECASCNRTRELSSAGNCLACGQLRQGYPRSRLQSHIVIAEHGRPSRVFTSETSKQEFSDNTIVDRSENYWQSAFRYAMEETSPARHPYILALAISKQPLSGSQILLNCDPGKIIVSYNPDFAKMDSAREIDLAAYRKLSTRAPTYDADSKRPTYAAQLKHLDELGLTREVRNSPEWRLHLILTGERKSWQIEGY